MSGFLDCEDSLSGKLLLEEVGGCQLLLLLDCAVCFLEEFVLSFFFCDSGMLEWFFQLY